MESWVIRHASSAPRAETLHFINSAHRTTGICFERAGFLVHRKECGLRARQSWVQVQIAVQSFASYMTHLSRGSLLFFKREIIIPRLQGVKRIQ